MKILWYSTNHSLYNNPQMTKGLPSHSKGKAIGASIEEISSNRIYGSYKVVENKSDMKYPTSIWKFPKPHPSTAISSTEKPIDLCRYALRTYTNVGGGSIGQLLRIWVVSKLQLN